MLNGKQFLGMNFLPLKIYNTIPIKQTCLNRFEPALVPFAFIGDVIPLLTVDVASFKFVDSLFVDSDVEI